MYNYEKVAILRYKAKFMRKNVYLLIRNFDKVRIIKQLTIIEKNVFVRYKVTITKFLTLRQASVL